MMQLPVQIPNVLKDAAQSLNIALMTKENPGRFSFARPLHGSLDCAMKRP
jgi:hypothetical protein